MNAARIGSEALCAQLVPRSAEEKFRQFFLSCAPVQALKKSFNKGIHACRRCLAAGTLVETDMGPMPIEIMTPGMKVLARSELDPDGPLIWAEVKEVHFTVRSEMMVITLDDGAMLTMTPDHVVWEEEAGWVEAHALGSGNSFRGPDRSLRRISSVELVEGTFAAFNLTVEPAASFFANGQWVHNCAKVGGFGKPRRWEPNPKHDRPGGGVSPHPTNPEATLQTAIEHKPGVLINTDPAAKELTIFRLSRETDTEGIWHGYAVSPDDFNTLPQDMKNAFYESGLTNLKGKIQ